MAITQPWHIPPWDAEQPRRSAAPWELQRQQNQIDYDRHRRDWEAEQMLRTRNDLMASQLATNPPVISQPKPRSKLLLLLKA